MRLYWQYYVLRCHHKSGRVVLQEWLWYVTDLFVDIQIIFEIGDVSFQPGLGEMLVDLTMVSWEFDWLIIVTLFLDAGRCDCAICLKIVIILPMIVIPRSFRYSKIWKGWFSQTIVSKSWHIGGRFFGWDTSSYNKLGPVFLCSQCHIGTVNGIRRIWSRAKADYLTYLSIYKTHNRKYLSIDS